MQELFDLLETMPIYLRMAVLFGFALVLATITVLVAYPLVSATARRVRSYSLEAFTQRTRNLVFWILTFFLALSFWSGIPPVEEGEPDPVLTPAVYLIRTLFYFFVGLFLIRLVGIGADTVRHRYTVDDKDNLRERKILTQLQYVQRIAAIVIFFIMLALIMMQFDSMRNLGTTLLTSAGVGGIIIGLAAQKSIANLLAGFQIAFTQPIRLDDALIVNGEYGWVEEITLTYVTLRLWDQRRLIIPLQKFIDDTFQNWTRTNSELIGTVFMYVDYTFPVQELRDEVDRWVPTQELWDGRVKSVAVTDNSDQSVTIRILVSAKDAPSTFDLRCNTREHLIRWIQEHHGDSLPKTRVEMQNVANPALLPAEKEE
ncbi:mechanosensitive ion channel [Neolewinella lacunae]|uniref:Mechanosensitive ion channel n=1 Tax=Neolewinella lacunae TaxID=1517758 RepID=A0A923PSI5_9BACT|nr:mechanosensitive ion channel domain-containing protein [Neolewinella lacunae]MBC6996694.1 mechanosensitive ion channel [Neolewinella lacunae]MDN3633441.1 mechanosensitive ion channel [Neolewinella lacunae]